MARTSQTITQAEVDAFQRGCAKHKIDPDDTNFGNLIGEYIAVTWGVDVTDESFDIALQKLKEAGHNVPFKSQARIQFDKFAAQYPEQAKALIGFLGQQHILLNTGDELYANASALLPQLLGREITFTTLYPAIGRAQYRGAQLYFTPGPEADRSVVNGKVNHAAKSNESFMPKSEVCSTLDQSYESNPLRHKADPKHQPEPVLDSTEARWKDMAQKLLRTGNSHAENDELENCFNGHSAGGSWRRTFEAMNEIKRDRMRRAAVAW